MRVTAVLLALVASCALVTAQSQQPPTLRGGVELIEVDVTVLDDRGRPVPDLRVPEFTVNVDGEERRVASLEYVSVGGPAASSALDSTPPNPYYSSNQGSPGRLIVVVIDQGNIRPGGDREVIAATSAFVERLTAADQVAFAAIPAPGSWVDFTANHELVGTALQRVVGEAYRPAPGAEMGVWDALLLSQHRNPFEERELVERLCGPFANSPRRYTACRTEVLVAATNVAARIRAQNSASIGALGALVNSLREVAGPKSLVLVSEGLIVDGRESELADIASVAAAARVSIHALMLESPVSADVSQMNLSPTARRDRRLEERGLELLSGMTTGGLFRVVGGSDAALVRLDRELSGYYVLGVETEPRDRDGRRHQVRVAVRRPGTTVRSRQEFQVASEAPAGTDEALVARTLRAPLPRTGLPLRLATYAYQDSASSQVRVLFAAEIEPLASEPSEFVIGYAVVDREGHVAAQSLERTTLEAGDGRRAGKYVSGFLVDPGTYTLKLAAIDRAGRVGSVERQVQAWQMAGARLAVGDLMLADAPPNADDTITPGVDVRADSGRLAAYMELYGNRLGSLDGAKVIIEIAASESGPALTSGVATPRGMADARFRAVSAIVPVGGLPPGPYVARAIVSLNGETVGRLARPFHVPPGVVAPRATATAAGAEPAGTLPDDGGRAASAGGTAVVLPAIPAFQREDVLRPEVLEAFFDGLDKDRPAAKAAIARARSGRFEAAARQAFEAGDQLTASFLRGLELFIDGQLDQAATQFGVSLRIEPDFGPAALYLGACHAAAGRDRAAAVVWQKYLVRPGPTPIAYSVLGDALMRLGDAARAIVPLGEALAQWPEADDIRRRLAIAYAVTQQHGEALATLGPYLPDHPSDHEVLLVAIRAIYEAHAAGRSVGTVQQDRERVARYARAYGEANGPHQPLVAKWAEFVTRESR